MTYTQARAEAEQRILNGARAYAFARLQENYPVNPYWPTPALWFEALMRTRPNS